MSRNSPLIETAAFPNLTTGSKIGIFAPSHAVSAGAIKRGVSTLQKTGFTVDCPDDLISPPFDGCALGLIAKKSAPDALSTC
jgi:hypothetical protein